MKGRITTAEEAVSIINSGDRVFIHSIAAAPQKLVKAMTDRAGELSYVEIVHIHTDGEAPYSSQELSKSFHVNALFVASNVRAAVQGGWADYTPVFLSDIPRLFTDGVLPLDVAMIHVSPPDQHGFCSLGVSVEVSHAAVMSAKKVIAQVNPNMPRTHGDGVIHVDSIDLIVEVDDEILEVPVGKPNDIESRIGGYVAELVEDGCTLQMGIGFIPDAVLRSLTNHKRLGIHTEMFSDGVIDLVGRGVITGEDKKIFPGKLAAGFVMGSRELYDFVDDNPMVIMLGSEFVNDTAIIRKNPKVTAINSAIEVDLTGQVCADSIGHKMFSGVGGQMDFIRGAALSQGGKPIIALPSVTRRGETRIVPILKPGAGVVTTRAHVHHVVTEYGRVNLFGKNLRERARSLIDLAHPDHREELTKQAHELLGLAC